MSFNYEYKDKMVLFGWITGILILISIIWISTQTIQTKYLIQSVNKMFVNINDSRRVTEYIPKKFSKIGLMGYWFSMSNTSSQMFVFTVFMDGILVPLGAFVSVNGNVEDIMPLSSHAVQVFESIPQSILQIYIERIELTTGYPEGRR